MELNRYHYYFLLLLSVAAALFCGYNTWQCYNGEADPVVLGTAADLDAALGHNPYATITVDDYVDLHATYEEWHVRSLTRFHFAEVSTDKLRMKIVLHPGDYKRLLAQKEGPYVFYGYLVYNNYISVNTEPYLIYKGRFADTLCSLFGVAAFSIPAILLIAYGKFRR